MPIFCKTWNKINATYPIINSLLNGISILLANRIRWKISAKYTSNNITEPIKPNSSPITEKIKSVWFSGIYTSP